MKIVKISKVQEYPMCDQMLASGNYSDTLFDECFIHVELKTVKHLYRIISRKVWEDRSLKIQNSKTCINSNGNIDLYITMSEALSFIYSATPPMLQHKIYDSHKSVDDIIKSLEAFLIDNDKYITYSSLFEVFTKLASNNPEWINFNRIQAGADLINSDNGFGLYIFESTKEIAELISHKTEHGTPFTEFFACGKINLDPKHENIKKFLNIMIDRYYNLDIKFENFAHIGSAMYVAIHVKPNSGAIEDSPLPRVIRDIIKTSYDVVEE